MYVYFVKYYLFTFANLNTQGKNYLIFQSGNIYLNLPTGSTKIYVYSFCAIQLVSVRM